MRYFSRPRKTHVPFEVWIHAAICRKGCPTQYVLETLLLNITCVPADLTSVWARHHRNTRTNVIKEAIWLSLRWRPSSAGMC